MNNLSPTLLTLTLLGYAVGAVAGLLFFRQEKLANVCSFGSASLAALAGTLSSMMSLATGAAAANQSFALFPSLIPYIQFTVRADPLSTFFALIVSLLGLALSIYSLGYAKGFFGRKNVGVLGAFFNVLLLATTLVFLADNAFFFLIA